MGKCLITEVLQKRIVRTRCGRDCDISDATAWSSDVGCVACVALIAEGRERVAAQNAVGKS